MRRSVALIIALLALGLVAAGCGDDDDDGGAAATTEQPAPAETQPAETGASPEAAGGETLQLTADENKIAWDKDSLEAPAGSVTITLSNPSQIPHNVILEGGGIEEQAGDTVQGGGESTVTADLEPGEYTYYCSVSNHRQLGMEGTLTVK